VQAVEQEVRIDLRAKRPELRLAGLHLDFESTPLGLARLLEHDEQVADSQRQQIEEETKPEQQRLDAGCADRRRFDDARPLEGAGPQPREQQPRRAAGDRGGHGGRRDTDDPGSAERHAARDVPRGKAHEPVHRCERQRHQQRCVTRQRRVASERRRQDDADHEPEGEIERKAAAVRQDRVHRIK
jgi:hypothetical protein